MLRLAVRLLPRLFARVPSMVGLLISASLALTQFAAAAVNEGYAEVAGGRLYYQDTGGSGEVVVFMHPGSGNSLVFEKQLAPFSAAGFRVIAYDRAGQGRSTRSNAQGAGDVPEVHQLMDHLGIQRFHLVGVAGGGGEALQYVLAHPERVRSVVVSNSLGNVRDAAYSEMGQRMRPREFEQLPVEIRELGPSYRAVNPDGVRRWLELSISGARLTPPPLGTGSSAAATIPAGPPTGSGVSVTFDALSQLRVPTLLMTGDADLYTPPSVLRMFKEHMPRAEYFIVPESGHASQWENAEIFNRRVLAFLRKQK